MPGGFTSNGREGYQTLEDDNNATFLRNPPSRAPAAQPPAAAKQAPSPVVWLFCLIIQEESLRRMLLFCS